MFGLPDVSLSSPLIFTCVCSDLSQFLALTYTHYLHLLSLYLSSPLFLPFTFSLYNSWFAFFLKTLLMLSSSSPSLPLYFFAACSHRWSLLWPGYKPTPGGFPAGVGPDGVHREQGQTDLCHILRLQRTQRCLPGHQEWTAKEGESSTQCNLLFNLTHRGLPAVFFGNC